MGRSDAVTEPQEEGNFASEWIKKDPYVCFYFDKEHGCKVSVISYAFSKPFSSVGGNHVNGVGRALAHRVCDMTLVDFLGANDGPCEGHLKATL